MGNKTSLIKVINKVTNLDIDFLNLERNDQIAVLSYIKKKSIDIIVFGEKWYDILSNKFFVEVYTLVEGPFESLDKSLVEFVSFEEFYEFVRGQVYEHTCLFGYEISVEEIKKHNIDKSKLNFDAFIEEDIDSYTFEAIKNKEKIDDEEAKKRVGEIANWFKKVKTISSLKDLENKCEAFTSKFDIYYAKEIFFSILIQNYKESIKDYLLDYACVHDVLDGFTFDDVLLVYGKEAALYVIEHFKGGCSYTTQKRRVRVFKNALNVYESKKYKRSRLKGFDRKLQLFYVCESYSINNDCFLKNDRYFIHFEDFVLYLKGNLKSANLSHSSLKASEIMKYEIDENTTLPFANDYSSRNISKIFFKNLFVVKQTWISSNNQIILSDSHSFERFFDFVHFLKGDLSNSDFLLCDGIGNISSLKGVSLEDVKVTSEVAEKLRLPVTLLPDNLYNIKSFEYSLNNELETENTFLTVRSEDDDLGSKISYISDIHLKHKFDIYKCKTKEDIEAVTQRIAKTIGEGATDINIVAGDTSSDIEVFNNFINCLEKFRRKGVFFFVLGNHELWSGVGLSLEQILKEYKNIFNKEDHPCMYLIHNNLFYFDQGWHELSQEELSVISREQLREITRSARVIIFGGLGFSAENESFNASDGIYQDALDRESDVFETNRFYQLYKKVTDALSDKNLIVATHMPRKDWAGKDSKAIEGVVYVNGHSHRNYYYDNGKTRIYADNQVGYKGKRFSLKQMYFDFNYDWFCDYKDGIYEITKDDYIKYYRGIREQVTFNREFKTLYLLKRCNTLMFLMITPNGNLQILNGGAIRRAENKSVEYYYEHLVNYAKSVKLYLESYSEFQDNISKTLKSIGAEGTIHGCIVDIDFYNHLFLNPLDGSVIPYYAINIIDKYVYENLPSLLYIKCPGIYVKYKEKITNNDASKYYLETLKGEKISKVEKYVTSTEMYRMSRIIKGLQFTTKYNIVRLWSNTVVDTSSRDVGKLIVSSVISSNSLQIPENDDGFHVGK